MTGAGAWSKRRFDWKKQINKSRTVSRSAKQMASHLCDTCVNRDTGQFYHRNETLAEALGVTERTVQRYLKELVKKGWLCRVRVRGRRRTLQLSFPSGEEQHKGDICPERKTTKLAPKDDKAVVPNTNQVSNKKAGFENRPVSVVLVSDRERMSLLEWKAWFDAHSDYKGEEVLDRLRKAGGFHLPSRFPSECKADHETYLRFADTAMTRRN